MCFTHQVWAKTYPIHTKFFHRYKPFTYLISACMFDDGCALCSSFYIPLVKIHNFYIPNLCKYLPNLVPCYFIHRNILSPLAHFCDNKTLLILAFCLCHNVCIGMSHFEWNRPRISYKKEWLIFVTYPLVLGELRNIIERKILTPHLTIPFLCTW